jgi:hypothetical protein
MSDVRAAASPRSKPELGPQPEPAAADTARTKALAQALVEKRRRRAAAAEQERRRVAGLIAPDPAPLTAQNRRDLDQIETLLARAQANTAPARRAAPLAAARDLQGRVERDLHLRGERAWIKAALAETAALEAARGETVRIAVGQVRVSTRDALLDMWDRARRSGQKIDGRPAMTREQFQAGMELRALWARASAADGLGSQLGRLADGPRSAGGSGIDVAALRALKAKQRTKAAAHLARVLAAAEAAVPGEDAPKLLIEVAGHGRAIRTLTTGASKRDRYARVLRTALTAVGEVLFRPAPMSVVAFETRAEVCAFTEAQERAWREGEGLGGRVV